jgi:hypothetical protein
MMKGFNTKTVEAGSARFTLYELNGLQRLDHLDDLKRVIENQQSTGSALKDFLKIDLETQWLLVATCLKGPRWWVSKWRTIRKVKRLGTSVLNELYLAACTISNIPTPDQVVEAEKKLKDHSPQSDSVEP